MEVSVMGSNTDAGDILFVMKVCGGVYTETSGVITSPYFPNPYPRSRRCVYEIKLPSKSAVSLQFLDFDVEDNSMAGSCFYDHVTVRNLLLSYIKQLYSK